MTKIKWVEGAIGIETHIDGFRVSRSTLQSGGCLYWVHWFENPHYAAPHSRMSVAPHRSLSQVKAMIEFLKKNPLRYVNGSQLRQIKAEMLAIDTKFPEFCEKWQEAYKTYTAKFRDSGCVA